VPGAGLDLLRDDPFPRYFSAVQARYGSELRFAEIRRALQALSSLYVERRGRLARAGAAAGRGKRAAFALYYGPLHFLLVREIVRGSRLGLRPPARILDLGCGTGAAGAAWALESRPPAELRAVDSSGWAVAETRWTLMRLGLAGTAVRGDAAGVPWPRTATGIVAAFTANELPDEARGRLLLRLLDAGARGARLLVVEPIARGINPWWPEWASVFRAAGGREDEWRVRPPLPEPLALLGKAAGLDLRELTGRSLSLAQGEERARS
jgi:SAM-dependent methyltransferase